MRPWLVGACVVAATTLAFADGEDATKADAVFAEAQQLKGEGKTAEACAKYEEALRYNHNAVGTLLNVAKCAEDAGKVATAVKHYTQARDLAREHNLDEHKAAAEARLAATSPRVPTLAIEFAERLPNMKLVIDDVVISEQATTNGLPVDPGKRHVVVTAPGRLPYDTTVDVAEGKQHAIAIPKLAHPVTVKKARRTVGKIMTASGVALIGTGVLLGYLANRDYEYEFSQGRCMDVPDKGLLCDPEGLRRTSNAIQQGTTGTIIGGVGIAALGVGLVLWLTAPSERQTATGVTVLPRVTPDSAGLAAVGRF